MTIEINYSDSPDDPLINEETRRYAQLAQVLRSHTLLDVDCWSAVPGQPLQPGKMTRIIEDRAKAIEGAK
jgi:2-oxoglutarate ferredoxin oxidoreductase subunit alpha